MPVALSKMFFKKTSTLKSMMITKRLLRDDTILHMQAVLMRSQSVRIKTSATTGRIRPPTTASTKLKAAWHLSLNESISPFGKLYL